jgi:hypothetical protein
MPAFEPACPGDTAPLTPPFGFVPPEPPNPALAEDGVPA